MEYDKIIIGAGIYGLYSALVTGRKNEKILVLEKDKEAFKRATYINQARVHMGYHYPRSYSTAIKSKKYFDRFNKDFSFAIVSKFEQIYAISNDFSWTNAKQFEKFCKDVNIPCEKISTEKFFKDKICEGAFITHEYAYDAQILKKYFLQELGKLPNVHIKYNAQIRNINLINDYYEIKLNTEEEFIAPFVLNCTYSGVNEILQKLDYEKFKLKYELCEIILCDVDEKFKKIGITVMDGPFFSIMPFGKSEFHSLTSVTFTPHKTCFNELPIFQCQNKSKGFCNKNNLGNCNDCIAKPNTAWEYMRGLTKKYIKDEFKFNYRGSLFSMKPILKESEIDDSRPTIIKTFTKSPTFISVLSGKINTVYDLDEILK